MAIAREFDCKGWTADQYDRLIERMELGGRSAPGVLYHWASPTDEGVHVVDVYESRDVADRLARELIAPLLQELSLPMPQIREYEVRAIMEP
jgi:hypothetical protein